MNGWPPTPYRPRARGSSVASIPDTSFDQLLQAVYQKRYRATVASQIRIMGKQAKIQQQRECMERKLTANIGGISAFPESTDIVCRVNIECVPTRLSQRQKILDALQSNTSPSPAKTIVLFSALTTVTMICYFLSPSEPVHYKTLRPIRVSSTPNSHQQQLNNIVRHHNNASPRRALPQLHASRQGRLGGVPSAKSLSYLPPMGYRFKCSAGPPRNRRGERGHC